MGRGPRKVSSRPVPSRAFRALAAACLVGACLGAAIPVAGQAAGEATNPSAASEHPPAVRDSAFGGCPRIPAETAGRGLPFIAVRYLADDALEGRLAGSPGERCAGEFLAKRFARLGLEPGGEDGGWFQPVPLASHANPHAPGGTGRNVVGILRGGEPTLASEAVVVGAHYDHLGHGPFGSLAPESGAVHNGADDNASGVAALLAAAARLTADPPRRSIVFVAFTGEELGLLGSSRYAGAPAVPLDRTVAMLNMDMVGRLGDGPLIVYGTGTAREWEEILAEANRSLDLPLASQTTGYGPSDHTSFYARDVPVLHFFTNVHGDYHRPSDDWQKIDLEGVERVGELVARVARDVADGPEPPTLVEGAGAPPETGEGEGYGAWLGTVPDFTPVERGVRLAGVTEGSPAEAAGLWPGDVLVGLGGHEVGNLHDFTAALRAHRPGDEVELRVLRDGSEIVLHARLGSRSARAEGGS